ncbi:MAG: pilus assembly protein TadG-related protein [Actinomycetota bacterium]|nr:pilus assembly protein TadG-related protein [Actinomycetota bacterium]
MNAAHQVGRLLEEERGGVIALVAVSLPVLLLFAAFAIDVGNWFAHARDLQKQADAAALAGGGSYRTPCANDFIETETRRYSGAGAAEFNIETPANSANVTALINSTAYPNAGGADFSDGGRPCETGFVDVKMTERDIPLFFNIIPGLDGVVPAITAHARVEIRKVSGATGSMPIGVMDVNPIRGAAIFINEAAPDVPIAVRPLVRRTVTTLNDRSLAQWDNVGDPASVPIAAANNGIVIALSSAANFATTGTTVTAICGQPLTYCVRPGSKGARFLHGYDPLNGVGTALSPIVRDAYLYNGTCPDSSAPNFIVRGCTAGFKGQVDFGTGVLDPSAAPTQARVWAEGPGCTSGNPRGCPLTYNASGDHAGYWTTTGTPLSLPTGGGPLNIKLNIRTAAGGNTTIVRDQVQRSFSANSDSDPVEYIQVQNAVTSEVGVTSLSYGTHSLEVVIGVRGGLENASPSDPPVIMRVAGDSGSLNGAVNCDPNQTFRDEIAYGCQTQYQMNTGQACPNGTVPKNCVPVETGDRLGQFRQGMGDRLGSCPPNNWPTVASGDPRAVPVMIVPFGSFSGSGQQEVSVINFGHFYVVGWDQGNCADNVPQPGGGSTNGNMWGYFIKYIDALNVGQGGEDMCDLTTFGSCVAVMTQ